MKMLHPAIASIIRHEDVKFLLTNRIPRRLATLLFGWFSRLEHPLVRVLSIRIWRLLRAAIKVRLSRTGHAITLVPVAAILVASIRLNFLGPCTDVRRGGPRTARLYVPLARGEEMGWFQHGSTIIVFAPSGFSLAEGNREGSRIRVGEPLMRLPRGAPFVHP